jgi:hypothetical protein
MAIVRRYNRTAPVGNLITEQLARLGIENRVRQHMAPRVWAELVGPQVAGATEVEKVQDGVLYISTKSATWASELTFYKNDILRRLNDKLQSSRNSPPVIVDIRFLNRGTHRKTSEDERPPNKPTAEELDDVDLSPRELQAIQASIAGIGDSVLKEKMRSARIASAKLQTWRLDNGWGACPNCGELCPPKYPVTGELDCARCRIARNRRR